MIVNLTQHVASPEQIEVGVSDLTPEGRKALTGLLTVGAIPTVEELETRAAAIAALAPEGINAAMIGGASPLMRALRRALKARGVQPLEAFTERRSVEVFTPTGVEKRAIFVHAGWWPDVD